MRSARELVELVIPTYGRPGVIVKAVESALAETPFRVTVLDDQSPEPVDDLLAVLGQQRARDDRLRIIRNSSNLGASLNILRSLEVSRAPYTWAFTDDHVVRPGAAKDVVSAISERPDAVVLFWHRALPQGERRDLADIAPFVELIERDRASFGFSDLHFNRIVRTDVGRRYLKLDARYSHAQPMLGIQIAALVDGLPLHIRGGELSSAQSNAASGWSSSYLQRYKFEPALLIPDPNLRGRYRAAAARDFPWREALIDLREGQRGSIDAGFAVDAAIIAAHSPFIPARLRIEARIALFLHGSRLRGLFAPFIPKKRPGGDDAQIKDMTW